MFDTETVDKEVLAASQAALESGRITPLIKVELWAKIQARRLSEGKEELSVDFTPPNCAPLTDIEKQKQQKRRESNKIAARKCRRKKSEKKWKIEQIKDDLEEENRNLHAKVKALEEEKQIIIEKLCLNATSIRFPDNPNPPPQTVEPVFEINQPKFDNTTNPIIATPVIDEDEELHDIWYINSSQEVPTSSSPPPHVVERLQTITTPMSECGPESDMMDDKWLASSFVSLDEYLV